MLIEGSELTPASFLEGFWSQVRSPHRLWRTVEEEQRRVAQDTHSCWLLLAAESPSGPGEDLAWSPGCDRHMAVQGRLNIVEETVEKTVEHLEAEVTGLLGLLEELASNLPPGPFSPKPDLLGDDGF